MLIHLALCHTIILDDRTGKYNASSPDELALVNAAKFFGVVFKKRDEIIGHWRKNQTERLWDDNVDETLLLGHAKRSGCFHLAFGNGEKTSAVVFRLVSGIIQGKAKNAGNKWLEFDSNIRQPIKQNQELDEQRRASDEFDVKSGYNSQGEWPVNSHDGHGES
jgi:magnesium-transporting ATPase (P-type)